MVEVVEKRTTVRQASPGQASSTTKFQSYVEGLTAVNFIYYIAGILEILLGFRLILRLLGANPGSGFVALVYAISRPLILPFEGIFRRVSTEGVETTAVLEPSTIAAMVVYAVLTWIIAKFFELATKQEQ